MSCRMGGIVAHRDREGHAELSRKTCGALEVFWNLQGREHLLGFQQTGCDDVVVPLDTGERGQGQVGPSDLALCLYGGKRPQGCLEIVLGFSQGTAGLGDPAESPLAQADAPPVVDALADV